MKKILIAYLLLFSGRLIAQKTIISDPNAELRSVSRFSAISVSGGIDLYLSQGDEDGVVVSASEAKYNSRIITSVENDVLHISYQGNIGRYYLSGKQKMIAYVSFRSLSGITASGSSDVYLNGQIKGDALTLQFSGASDFNGKVAVNKLVITQSGASDVNISGKASGLEAGASGASDLKGYDLETETCTASASGASSIKVTVTNALNATASGASSIYYKGTGQIKQSRASGASNVARKG